MADEKKTEYMTKQMGDDLYREVDELKARIAQLEGARTEEDVRHKGVKGFWLAPEDVPDAEPLKPGQAGKAQGGRG